MACGHFNVATPCIEQADTALLAGVLKILIILPRWKKYFFLISFNRSSGLKGFTTRPERPWLLNILFLFHWVAIVRAMIGKVSPRRRNCLVAQSHPSPAYSDPSGSYGICQVLPFPVPLRHWRLHQQWLRSFKDWLHYHHIKRVVFNYQHRNIIAKKHAQAMPEYPVSVEVFEITGRFA